MTWKCEVSGNEPLKVVQEIARDSKKQVQPKALTVGQRFDLKCSGESQNWNLEKLTLKVPSQKPEEKTWQILKALDIKSRSQNEIQFVVVSYKASQMNVPLQITDGTLTVDVEPIALNLESVIQKPEAAKDELQATQEQPKKPEPYPGYGALKLSYPLYYWWILFAILVAILLAIYYKYSQNKKWQKFRKELLEKKFALGPIQTFHKHYRDLLKQVDTAPNFITSLEKEAHSYIEREYIVPIASWGISKSLRVIETKRKDLPKEKWESLRRNLEELQKLKATEQNLNAEDKERVSKRLKKAIDEIHFHTLKEKE
jgi:hypothetical protein